MFLLKSISTTQHYAIVTVEVTSTAQFLIYNSYDNREEWEAEIAKLDIRNTPYRAMIVNPVTVTRTIKIEENCQ